MNSETDVLIRGLSFGFGIHGGVRFLRTARKLFLSRSQNQSKSDLSWKNLFTAPLGLDDGTLAPICTSLALGSGALAHAWVSKKLVSRGVSPAIASGAGGAVASGALMLLDHDFRQALALHTAMRVVQGLGSVCSAALADAKPVGMISTAFVIFLRHAMNYADVIVFSVANGIVMCFYVMEPDTLGAAFWNYVVHTGPIDKSVLRTLRLCIQNDRSVPPGLGTYLASNMASWSLTATAAADLPPDPNQSPLPGEWEQELVVQPDGTGAHLGIGRCVAARRVIMTTYCRPSLPGGLGLSGRAPCILLHPHSLSCNAAALRTFRQSFCKAIPFYSGVFLAPHAMGSVVRILRAVSRGRVSGAPLRAVAAAFAALVATIKAAPRLTKSIVRSSTFMGLLVALYMRGSCLTRYMSGNDNRFTFLWIGVFAGIALLVEPPHSSAVSLVSRRPELAIYVLVRALRAIVLMIQARARPPLPSSEPSWVKNEQFDDAPLPQSPSIKSKAQRLDKPAWEPHLTRGTRRMDATFLAVAIGAFGVLWGHHGARPRLSNLSRSVAGLLLLSPNAFSR